MSDEKTAEDVAKLSRAIALEREDHKATKLRLKAADATIAERATLGENPTASSIANHVSNVVKATVAQQTIDQQRRIAELETSLTNANAATVSVQAQLNKRSIAEEIRTAAAASHVKESAVNDLISLAHLELTLKDGIVQNAEGLTATGWLESKKSTSAYMWPLAVGSGARGSGADLPTYAGENPFRKGATYNLTRQGQLVKENPTLATKLMGEASAH